MTPTQYTQLSEAAHAARESLDRPGASGDHYGLAWMLRGLGIVPASDRRELVKQAERLLNGLRP